MKIGVVIELNERLERNAKPAAVIKDCMVVVRDPPGPRIEIEAVVEHAALRWASELAIGVATPDRPVSTSGAVIVLQDLDPVADLAELERRRHSREPGAQNDDGRALRIALELDRAAIGRLGGETEARHRLIHRSPAGARPDQREQIAPP